ncbi:hypothetical protein EI94DRAFT_1696895 [Lactarius quietus]|nr:hypothetical protein EI94DRAFT_1696895 [Lactarius quietus]
MTTKRPKQSKVKTSEPSFFVGSRATTKIIIILNSPNSTGSTSPCIGNPRDRATPTAPASALGKLFPHTAATLPAVKPMPVQRPFPQTRSYDDPPTPFFGTYYFPLPPFTAFPAATPYKSNACLVPAATLCVAYMLRAAPCDTQLPPSGIKRSFQ